MGKFGKIFTILLLITVFVLTIFFILGSLKPKFAGIYIETNLPASVWINDKQLGRTPFRKRLPPGDVFIKLIPDSFGEAIAPYETKLTLLAGLETVVRYDFGETVDESSGDVVSFEKTIGGDASMVVVSSPEEAQFSINGREGFSTPFKVSPLTPGVYELVFTNFGYKDRTVKVRARGGYKLIVVVKLAKQAEIENNPPAFAIPEDAIGMIEILSTSTGFLRVREKPSTTADEIGQVAPGERYPLVSIDKTTGWFEIELRSGKRGWVSSQYARKIDSTRQNTEENIQTLPL
jgi:hypothetical protein